MFLSCMSMFFTQSYFWLMFLNYWSMFFTLNAIVAARSAAVVVAAAGAANVALFVGRLLAAALEKLEGAASTLSAALLSCAGFPAVAGRRVSSVTDGIVSSWERREGIISSP